MNNNKKTIILIPARIGSTRLPNKPLLKINGKEMILHVWENAISSIADKVIVATDSKNIHDLVEDNGGQSQEVQDDFELIAFDFVSNPSTHGAFLHPTNESINESKIVGRTCGDYCKVESIINDIMRGS